MIKDEKDENFDKKFDEISSSILNEINMYSSEIARLKEEVAEKDKKFNTISRGILNEITRLEEEFMALKIYYNKNSLFCRMGNLMMKIKNNYQNNMQKIGDLPENSMKKDEERCRHVYELTICLDFLTPPSKEDIDSIINHLNKYFKDNNCAIFDTSFFNLPSNEYKVLNISCSLALDH